MKPFELGVIHEKTHSVLNHTFTLSTNGVTSFTGFGNRGKASAYIGIFTVSVNATFNAISIGI